MYVGGCVGVAREHAALLALGRATLLLDPDGLQGGPFGQDGTLSFWFHVGCGGDAAKITVVVDPSLFGVFDLWAEFEALYEQLVAAFTG